MSLYDGLGPNLAKEGVPLTVYLACLKSVKLYLLDNTTFFNEHVILCYLVAGGCGEFIASFIRAPAEAVKSRTQTGATISEAMQSNFPAGTGTREHVKRGQLQSLEIFRLGPFKSRCSSRSNYFSRRKNRRHSIRIRCLVKPFRCVRGYRREFMRHTFGCRRLPIDSTNGIRRRGSGKHFVEPRGRRGVDASHGKEQ